LQFILNFEYHFPIQHGAFVCFRFFLNISPRNLLAGGGESSGLLSKVNGVASSYVVMLMLALLARVVANCKASMLCNISISQAVQYNWFHSLAHLHLTINTYHHSLFNTE
jgi:hypothetical protein